MSYDLMVFEPEAAPCDHERFLEWFSQQTKWNEGHSYGDPGVTSARLRAWFVEIVESFPPLNGVLAKEQLPVDEASTTDYSIEAQMIYGCFAWSKAAQAYEAVFELAAKHGIGFFNVSSHGEEVWLPEHGKLVLAHSKRVGLVGRLKNLLTPGQAYFVSLSRWR